MQTYISSLPPRRPAAAPRSLSLLGSTGSIGTQALEVVRAHPDRLRVAALAAGRNAELLAQQAAEFRPSLLCVMDKETADRLRPLLPGGYAPDILTGEEGCVEAARLEDADMVLSSIVGAAGLRPTHAAVAAGKMVALANKESLVLAGHLVREMCAETGATILPVDSEHNALFQAAAFEEARALRRLVLTASGGPFRHKEASFLENVTPKQALNHPNWSMGAKISIDSATLMNKGLEVIEACHLFGVDMDRVGVVVHPQSIVHSLAEFVDGSMLAHMGAPDMRVAIAHCLCFPERVGTGVEPVDLAKLGGLTFEEPRWDDFPCLRLAREAYAASRSHPIVLNAANEVAVELFLAGRLPFLGIPGLIDSCLAAHDGRAAEDLESILDLDREARQRARELARAGEAA
ncbi:1-deoxy-D-xylulose-5-phosphate reductoisomerase [Desulfohalovibrio reitneri]|uniref:1-deoxy-D-xylulose-5-phosphate reductoisomerase n=1 Tax=Desulfohalovibrio reitneri TaxID=1307759 RepID=UPI0004A6EE13|nr:1-deoxy-D-xylulose-5-phosphate reductoisomerase [Desulfohalovibrio reitneri]